MKLKFREKTYLITLVLFLIFFNSGLFSLAFYTYQKNTDAAELLCYDEKSVIAESFGKDLRYFEDTGIIELMSIYGDYYAEKDIFLSFSSEEVISYSSLPMGLSAPTEGTSATQRAEGKRYFLITEPLGRFCFTYAKDVSHLDEDFKSISTVFVLTSFGAGGLLAICLFFVLRKLSKPLERLRIATYEIANGNFKSRADESGNDEFSLLASDFNRMTEYINAKINQLELATQTKQQMLDNLAHEMRTPLTSIRGYAEYLRDANIEENEKIEALSFIISESVRLEQIGKALLDEAFINANGITPEALELSPLIYDSAKALSAKAAERNVELKTEAAEAYIKCDKTLINILITNLAENAIKACKDGGTVIIGCKKDENDRPMLFVSDNGIGMEPEQLLHITEPFYRVDKSRSRQNGGTGLGLSLCKKITDAHKAELIFISELGKGTTAKVLF